MAHFAQKSYSASLTSVSVTLSNSRPSFRGALAAGNTAGSSAVIVNTTPNAYPSTSALQLVEGDTVSIGEAGSLGSYTVANTDSASTFYLTGTLAAGDVDVGDDVIATASSTLTVRFTTASAITDGTFRILVPAHSTDATSADGIPDGSYFDFTDGTPTVTCPANITGYTFTPGTPTPSSVTLGGVDYHEFTCDYTGAGAVGTAFDGTTNDAITIDSLINPAPKPDHANGTADTYRVIVQHINASAAVVDSTTVAIGTIEAVKVTATVAPQISFTIAGVNSGTSACGITTDVTTTAVSVPFGEVAISSFIEGAQTLSVSTNAVGGFSVTARENDQLGLNGDPCVGDPTITGNTSCIADSRGDNTTMSDTTSDEWANTATKGFAYSLHDSSNTTTEAFAYNESSRTFSAKQFADVENSGTAQTIFSSTGPADSHNLYVCYRIIVGATTAAGNYENNLIYTATATF